MRVEEAVGQRVRDKRIEAGLKQEEFGRQVGDLVGRNWSRSTVSVAEKGGRVWTAAELVAIAMVLGTTVGDLLRPPLGETAVELGGRQSVPSNMVGAAVTARLPEDLNWEAIQKTLRLLADTAARSQEEIMSLARQLDAQIMQRVTGGGVFRLPLAGPEVEPVPLKPGEPRGGEGER